MIYRYIGRHQMNRRSYLCLYVYDNSKEFKIGIAGFSIYGTKSEKLRFYLGSSSQNFFSPPNSKCSRGPWTTWFSTRHLNICLIVRPALKETSILLVSYVGARGVAYYTYLPPQGKMFPQKIGNEMILFPGIVAYCQGIIYKYSFFGIYDNFLFACM